MRMLGMLDEPSSLLQPAVLGRVLAHWVLGNLPSGLAAAVGRAGEACSSLLISLLGKQPNLEGRAKLDHNCSEALLRILGVM